MIHVPSDATDEDLDRYQAELQASLDRVREFAEANVSKVGTAEFPYYRRQQTAEHNRVTIRRTTIGLVIPKPVQYFSRGSPVRHSHSRAMMHARSSRSALKNVGLRSR